MGFGPGPGIGSLMSSKAMPHAWPPRCPPGRFIASAPVLEAQSNGQPGSYERGTEEFSRVLAFSDGLFAIAMTLLVVGIAVPKLCDSQGQRSRARQRAQRPGAGLRQLLHQLRGDRALLGRPSRVLRPAGPHRHTAARDQSRLPGLHRLPAVPDGAAGKPVREPALGGDLRGHGGDHQRPGGGAVPPGTARAACCARRSPRTSTAGA